MKVHSSVRVLLCGGWTEVHTGDDAILLETIRVLKEQMPAVHFDVAYSDQGATEELLGQIEGTSITPAIERLMSRYNVLISHPGRGKLYNIFARLRYLLRLAFLYCALGQAFPLVRKFLGPEERALGESLRRCDAVIMAGGGYLNSQYRFFWLYSNICFIRLCSRLKIPVYCAAQSYVPLSNKRDRFCFSRGMRDVRAIGTRDHHSLSVLSRARIPEKRIIIEPDTALTLAASVNLPPWVDQLPSNFIAVSLVPGKVPDHLCTALLKKLKGEFGWDRLVFFAHMKRDEDYITKLSKNIFQNEKLRIVEPHTSPAVHKALLGRAALGIGARYHFCLFGLASGVPIISLRTEAKFSGLYHQFECARLMVECTPNENALSEVFALASEIQKNRATLSAALTLCYQQQLTRAHTVLNTVATDLRRKAQRA